MKYSKIFENPYSNRKRYLPRTSKLCNDMFLILYTGVFLLLMLGINDAEVVSYLLPRSFVGKIDHSFKKKLFELPLNIPFFHIP